MEKLVDFLNKNNISYIISVDDEYSTKNYDQVKLIDDISKKFETNDIYKEVIEKFSSMPLSALEKNADIRKRVIKDTIKKMKDQGEEEKLKQLYKEAQKNGDVLLENLLNKLKEEDEIDQYELIDNKNDANDLIEKINEIWSIDEQNKVLWLLDLDMSNSDGEKDEGYNLLNKIRTAKLKWNIAVILTQEVESDLKDDKLKDHLRKCDQNNLIEHTNLIWIISKSVLSGDYSTFTRELKKGFRRNFTYQITDSITEIFSSGLNEAKSNFKNMDQSLINHLIVKSSQEEGISIIEMLERILNIYMKDNVNKKLKEKFKGDLAEKIKEYENLCDESKLFFESADEELYNLRNLENYDYNINNLYNPVGFGDIFVINNQKYILLSQPCDVALRPKGTRKLTKGLLYKINDIDPRHDAVSELNYLEKNSIKYVDYRDFITVDFNILDLCALNDDGVAKVNLDWFKDVNFEDKFYFLNMGLRKRVKKIIDVIDKEYKDKNEFEEAIKFLEDENISEEKIEVFRNQSVIKKERMDISSFIIEDEFLKYDLERICRLDELVATKLWIDISNYNTRIGLPGDFASDTNYLEYDLYGENLKTLFGDGNDEEIDYNKKVKLHKKPELLGLHNESLKKIKKGIAVYRDDRSKISIDQEKQRVLLEKDIIPLIFNDKEYFVNKNGEFKIPIDEILKMNSDFKDYLLKQIEKDEVDHPSLYQIVDKSKKKLKKYYSFRNSKKTIGDYTIKTKIDFKNNKFLLDVEIFKNE